MKMPGIGGGEPKDAPLIYFAHIGKVAGTSIRHAAIKSFGRRRCVSLYTPDHAARSRRATRIFFEDFERGGDNATSAQAVVAYMEEKRVRFFSTHHNQLFRDYLPPEQTFVMLREPVARLISHYNFWQMRGLMPADESFEAFIRRPICRNEHFRSIRAERLDDMALIGIQEHFDASVAAFNKVFGTTLRPMKSNTTPKDKQLIRRDALPSEVLQQIHDLNRKDMDLYERCRVAFEKTWL
ncbi:MAG: sulfotransferase family 2 domain-containing protein [Pseudomonadota bacterium]